MLLGIPAEEGGGKELMLRNDVFADVDAAMMIHPANHEYAVMRESTVCSSMVAPSPTSCR